MKNAPKCHAEPFACHSERSEESLLFRAQGKLREASLEWIERFEKGFLRSGSGLLCLYKTIASTSATPSATQQMALPRSPANQNPLAALKQRTALVQPLTHAPGLLSIFRSFIFECPVIRSAP